jgi:MFS family permease
MISKFKRGGRLMDMLRATRLSQREEQLELKNLFLFSTGKLISVLGSSIYTFALGLYVLKMTGSALSFSITLIFGILPMILFLPFAGVIADKFDKKTLVVAMDLLNGVLLISVFFISSFSGLNLFLIYGTTFLLTVFSTFFGAALEAAKPNIVSKKKLMDINSIGKMIDSVSLIAGPMLGGVIYALVDIRTFIIMNGISFILSGISLMFVNFKLVESSTSLSKQDSHIHFINDIKEGFQYLYGKKNIMGLIMVLISLNFFLGYAVTVPLPYIINTVLQLGPKEFGLIEGAMPAGMIIGVFLVKKITRKIPYPVLLRRIGYSLAFFMILSGIPVIVGNLQFESIYYTGFYMVVMLFFGISVALIDIPMAYMMQTEIREEYRGRVLSIGVSIGKTMLPIAMIISGALLNMVPAYILPISGGVLFLLSIFRASMKVKVNLGKGM